MKRFICCALLFLPFCVLPRHGALAQSAAQTNNLTSAYFKAYQLGMGGAWRSVAWGGPSILVNPAGISMRKTIGGSFDFHTSGYNSARVFSGSFYDSRIAYFGTGLAYDRTDLTLEGRGVSVDQVGVVVSKDFAEMFYAGTSVKYIHIGRDSLSGGTMHHFTGDMGFTFVPVKNLALSMVVQNLYSWNKHPEIPLLLGFGANVALGEAARLSVDLDIDFSTPAKSSTNYYFGGEFNMAKGILVRGGYAYDRVRDNPFFSVGAGFHGPSLSIDFTFSERLRPVEQTYAFTINLAR